MFSFEFVHITHLYELRHFVNCNSLIEASNEMNLKVDYIEELYDSDIHGSQYIGGITNQNFDSKFKQLLKNTIDREKNIEQTYIKNNNLVQSLKKKRKTFCNLSTNKVKRRLTKINTTLSNTYRLAFEIEEVNILAKDSSPFYKDLLYKKKNYLIQDLIDICETEFWKYGMQTDNSNSFHNKVIFFELPNCEQISWHYDTYKQIKKYDKEWDKKINSTLNKLEVCIKQLLVEYKLDK